MVERTAPYDFTKGKQILTNRKGGSKMSRVKLIDQKQCGLLPGVFPCVVYNVRATRATVVELRAAEATVEVLDLGDGYKVVFGDIMPLGIVATYVNGDIGLRMEWEPEYPQESTDSCPQINFTPCPTCRAPTSAVPWLRDTYAYKHRICTRTPYHHLKVMLWPGKIE